MRECRISCLSRMIIKRGQKIITGVECFNTACLIVSVSLMLACLPLLRPEPCLIRWHRQRRPQLDDVIVPLNDLNLSTRLVKMHPLTHRRRQKQHTARLHTHINRFCTHRDRLSEKPYCSNTENPLKDVRKYHVAVFRRTKKIIDESSITQPARSVFIPAR